MAKVRVAFLWHMHQPLYREPETGEYLMPWVRLHATRAYNDMAAALERHERVRCTVNLTPVLLEQLDDYAAGRARDRFLDLSRRPAADLTAEERQSILRSFFMVDWDTCVKAVPRYWELLEKRGRDTRNIDLEKVAPRFSDDEITDLQVLFNLAWMGFAALEEDEELRALRDKGRDYGAADAARVLEAQRRIAAGIVPRWRRLAERGQVELSTSPYHHPILPLVCDSDSAARALPGMTLPPRFSWPEDARWQVRAAQESHSRWFGARPSGMWPAEGAVSPEALEILASEGVGWAGSDEGVLLRSLPGDASRTRSVYRPWRVGAGGGREVAMLFRDRGISDLIGFTYARTRAREAAADLISHLAGIGEAWASEKQAGPATVGIFLDGENPWEHYPRSGADFLDALYGALERHQEFETTTLAAATAEAPGPPLATIHSGSWIEASYRIWIGHEEDRRAWTALGRARQALADVERRGGSDPERLEEARRHLYAAEGSDWYWWYGEDFTTELAAEFDGLFRGQVMRACELLGIAPPFEALSPIKRAGSPGPLEGEKPLREPTQLIAPVIDGRDPTYFEWQGAGLYRPGQHRGSMFGGAQAFHVLYYGFDLENLYLRLDPAESPARSAEVSDRLRVALLTSERQLQVDFEVVPDGVVRPGRHLVEPVGRCAFLLLLEIAIPFAALGLGPGGELAVSLHAMRGEVELERLPRHGFLAVVVPGPDFDRIHWRV